MTEGNLHGWIKVIAYVGLLVNLSGEISMKLLLRVSAALVFVISMAAKAMAIGLDYPSTQNSAASCLKEAQNYFDSALFGSSSMEERRIRATNLAAELCRGYRTPETVACASEAQRYFDNALFGNLSVDERRDRSSILAVELCKFVGTSGSIACAREAERYFDSTLFGTSSVEERRDRAVVLAVELCKRAGTPEAVSCVREAYRGFDDALSTSDLNFNERRIQALGRAVEFCQEAN